MTTRLNKPVKRIVPTRRDGDLVITLTFDGVMVRKKGTRTSYGPISYGKILLDGARIAVAEQERAKAQRRKMQRAARGGR